MAKKLGVDHRRPGGVPPLSAYAYQRSVSLPLANQEITPPSIPTNPPTRSGPKRLASILVDLAEADAEAAIRALIDQWRRCRRKIWTA
jgi:hypothetical protein